MIENLAEEQMKKSDLTFLFKYNCDLSKNRTVSCSDWNSKNRDLLAVSYGEFELESPFQDGYLMFWSLKNPTYPERIIKYPSSLFFFRSLFESVRNYFVSVLQK